VKYGEARQIAKVLNDIFGGGGGSFDTAAGQVQPRLGVTASSDRLSPGTGGSGTGTAGSSFGSSVVLAAAAVLGDGDGRQFVVRRHRLGQRRQVRAAAARLAAGRARTPAPLQAVRAAASRCWKACVSPPTRPATPC